MTIVSSHLLVHALPGEHGQDLAAALADVVTNGGADPLSLEDATTQLAQDPAHRLCILYVDPVRVICAAMGDGRDLAETLHTWTAATRAALTLHRRNRRRSMIFEAGHFQHYAAVALDRLEIQTDSRLLGAITDTAPPPTPLQYILAQSLLNEDPAAKAAADELDASAQLLSNDHSLKSERRTLEAYQDLQGKIGDAAQLPELHKELSTLRAARTADQKRAEEAEKETQTFQERLHKETAEKTRIAQEHTALSAELAALKTAHGAALEQIKTKTLAIETVQHQLETETAAKKALVTQLSNGKVELAAQKTTLTREIDARAAEIAKLEAQKQETGIELDTLAAKVGSLSAQVEHTITTRDQMMLEMASQQQAQTTIRNANHKKLERATAALQERETALSEAQAHIEHLMNSRSMRLTRPLRAAVSFLRGSR